LCGKTTFNLEKHQRGQRNRDLNQSHLKLIESSSQEEIDQEEIELEDDDN